MDLHEAIRLLGLDASNNFNEKDVEKSFRKQALVHHPDKGGDASHFQLLHRAKDRLLEQIGENSFAVNKDTNIRSLHQHRACVRQVVAVNDDIVVAATDDGLVVMEGATRVVSFVEGSFLCCCMGRRPYAGSADGHVHWMELLSREWTSWKLPGSKRIVAISSVREFVAVATAEGKIYILDHHDTKPTVVWNYYMENKSGKTMKVSPETILLEEGSSPSCLQLWVGGGSNENSCGRLLMLKLDTEVDFWERHEMEDLLDEYNLTDSDTNDSCSDDDDSFDDDDNPITNVTVPEGPIFALSKHKKTIAVVSGQSIRIWNYEGDTASPQKSGNNLVEMKTIPTDTATLYTLCLNEKFLAAAGSGDSITVWERHSWMVAHDFWIPKSPGCHLATNCVMTLAWLRDADSSESLVSGGYDGNVTLWKLIPDTSRLNQTP